MLGRRVERSMENREEEGSSSSDAKTRSEGEELCIMVDRTSELPQVLLQHIQSFLPVPEAIRTSTLSKTWLHAWSTYPLLDFSPSHLCLGSSSTPPRGDTKFECLHNSTTKEEDEGSQKRKFIEYVDKTLARYRQQKTVVQRLRLTMDSDFASQVEDWIQTAIEIGTVKLCVSINSIMSSHESMLQLLLSVKQLKALRIFGVSQKNNRRPRLPCDTINCHSLRYLYLHRLQIDDRNLEYLFSCCPLIESLSLCLCTGFNKVHVAHLNRLRRLRLALEVNVVVDVEASNLNKIALHWRSWRKNKPGVFYIKPSQNLKFLTLCGTNITDTSLKNLLLNFPNLQTLHLLCSPMLERMDVSNHSLKSLFLAKCPNLAQAKIDAPSLVCFDYGGHIPLPPLSLSKFTNPTKRKISIYPPRNFDNSFLLNFRDFAMKEKLCKVNVCLEENPIDPVTDLEYLIGAVLPLSPDLEIKELSLVGLNCPLVKSQKLVKGLLWICQPKYFSVTSDLDHANLKKDLSKALSADRMNLTCCTSDPAKCWRYYLSEVEIKSVEKRRKDKLVPNSASIRWKFKLRRSKRLRKKLRLTIGGVVPNSPVD